MSILRVVSLLELVDKLRCLNLASIELDLEFEDFCSEELLVGEGNGNKNDDIEKVIELRLAIIGSPLLGTGDGSIRLNIKF